MSGACIGFYTSITGSVYLQIILKDISVRDRPKITVVAIQISNTAHSDPPSTSQRIITRSLAKAMADEALKQTPYK